mmetsp:Transcript_14350/g.21382  ORF Transcript_14350/g.21382 Transcript_14350/m.21382 type:complete len:1242 (-) Transcript_14350:68-3793(-)|eukprot:CAMPEP_0194121004 /NCGR_PEP_ID=MMETSP0150-20130528/45337_1 /TAXON_ID=122233 /ORGANISM="Chaetoceros debilis, Strain MM31A-1" /LENGTH=1241 /DNA_ID=CAMNT_0038813285 /DNA_START=56 /DNA_END=3781 /DNA_ORIENTATION=-
MSEKVMSEKDSPHDLLALGHFEKVLNHDMFLSNTTSIIPRLPFFLRLLSSSRPSANISHRHEDSVAPVDKESGECDTNIVGRVVKLLEIVAASYPAAEDIDLLTSDLAPAACRSLSRCSPLTKRARLVSTDHSTMYSYGKSQTGSEKTVDVNNECVLEKGVICTLDSFVHTGWNTDHLIAIAGMKFRQDHHGQNESSVTATGRDLDEEKEVNKDELSSSPERKKRKISELEGRASLKDSLQSSLSHTLEEIVSLIIVSLKPFYCHRKCVKESSDLLNTARDANDKNEEKTDRQENDVLPLMAERSIANQGSFIKSEPDSLLSEVPFSSSDQAKRQDTYLSSAITSLMHHSSVLRYEHISAALCRTNIPQCANIIKQLAMNSAGRGPSPLLRGCMNAYGLVANDSSIHDVGRLEIISTIRTSITAIATLSKKEAMNAISVLNQSRVMPELTYLMMIEHDEMSALATLLHDLRRCCYSDKVTDQRHFRDRSRVRKRCCIQEINHIASDQNLLMEAIKANQNVTIVAREFLVTKLIEVAETKEHIAWGKVAMIVRGLGMFVQIFGIGEASGTDFVKNSMIALLQLSKLATIDMAHRENGIIKRDESCVRPSCLCDDFAEASVCSACIICTKFLPLLHGHDNEDDLEASLSCKKLINSSLTSHISLRSNKFHSKLLSLILKGEEMEMSSFVSSCLFGVEELPKSASPDHGNFSEFCEWAKDFVQPEIRDKKASHIVNIMEVINGNKEDYESDSLIKRVFLEEHICNKIHGIDAILFTEQAISRLIRKDAQPLPHVLPITMEMNLMKCLNEINSGIDHMTVIQLLYCFMLIEKNPDSPFVINPKTLPIVEIVRIIHKKLDVVNSRLLQLIERCCPEMRHYSSDELALQHTSLIPIPSCLYTPKDAGQAIWRRANENFSPDGGVEQLFLASRVEYCSAEVDLEVVRAFSGCHFITYNNFCKDPLILLQCPLEVWLADDIRKIILSVFGRALAVNEVYVKETSATSMIASQFMISRDSLIVRCCVSLLSEVESLEHKDCDSNKTHGALVCPGLTSMVQRMIASRLGLTAMLIRQGLSEKALEWLIQHCPETFLDADELSNILESRALAPQERLQIADGSLRIAIVHGSRNEIESQRLVYNALSVSVSSFSLVVGPCGVPLVLTYDDRGRDITLMCRNVLFRILTLLEKNGGMSDILKDEATLALSRMARLCKSDGLAGTAPKRRRHLLKEVFDAIVRVNSSFGGGIQL